jgi:hypothetical protein
MVVKIICAILKRYIVQRKLIFVFSFNCRTFLYLTRIVVKTDVLLQKVCMYIFAIDEVHILCDLAVWRQAVAAEHRHDWLHQTQKLTRYLNMLPTSHGRSDGRR